MTDFVFTRYGLHGGDFRMSLPTGHLSGPLSPARSPRTSLYQLVDSHYETVKGVWEERFERRYGFWCGWYENAVKKYLDGGLFESGFARGVCPRCRSEFLVGFSCKGRGLCPSCGAKRAAIFSELLQHKILADVAHSQWVFSRALPSR